MEQTGRREAGELSGGFVNGEKMGSEHIDSGATNSKPLISVIVPVYNTKAYLPRCVESICAQTYANLEILLIDDGSTDGTDKICDTYVNIDSRIIVHHKENGGSSSARNLGLEKAKGEYIGFVDSDDYIEPDMYELLWDGIQKYDTAVAQIGRDEVKETGERLPDICVPPVKDTLIGDRDFLKELLLHKGDCSFCTKLFRREVLSSRQFPVGALNEDFHFLIEILPEIGTIVSLPKQAYHVFYRSNSNSRRTDREQMSRVFEDIVRNADMVLGQIDRKDKELYTIAVRFGIFQRLDYMLHVPISRMTKENTFYTAVVKRLRADWGKGMVNPYLTVKNKVYMTLFAIAPKKVRQFHRKLRQKRQAKD